MTSLLETFSLGLLLAQFTSYLQAVPLEIVTAEILQFIVDAWEHAIPVCHCWYDHIIEMFINQLKLQMLEIGKKLTNTAPAVVVKLQLFAHKVL